MNESTEQREKELRRQVAELKQQTASDRIERVRKKNETRELSAVGILVIVAIYLGSFAMTLVPFMQWLAIIGFIYACRLTYRYVQRKNEEERSKDENQPVF